MTELMLTDFGTALGRTGERFNVRRREQPNAEFAAEDVEHILVAGKGMSLSADAIAFAVERGVPVTLLSFSGEPYARIAGGTELNDAALRREQLFATRDARGTEIVRAVLNGKLRNQAATLRYFTKSRKESAPDLYNQLQDTADGLVAHATALEAFEGMALDGCRTDLMVLEAQAAREYWQAVALILPPDLDFPGRVRRGALDPVNASLNYGYGILYSHIWAAAARARLDPYTGFLHTLHEGKPTLVFDLIEEFRPWMVDRPLFADFIKQWKPDMDDDGYITQVARKDVARRILEHGEKRYLYRGKHLRADDILLEQVRAIARFLRDGTPIKVYVAPW